MSLHRICRIKFSSVYPMYVQKAERKNRTKEEVDRIICWLRGYNQEELLRQIEREVDLESFFAEAPLINPKVDLESFFAEAPLINPNVSLIKGLVCGVRVEEVEDPLMRRARYLDKLIDELAKGKAMEKILRQ